MGSMMMAVAGGMVVGAVLGAFIIPSMFMMYNSWNYGCGCYQRRRCYDDVGRDYYDCDDCARANPGQNVCGYQATRDIYRDDALVSAFRPNDYMPGSVKLIVKMLEGDAYDSKNEDLCP